MTPVEKRATRAAEYRRLASAADRTAEASVLAHVREKHEQAAAQWTALALLDERPREPAAGAPASSGQSDPLDHTIEVETPEGKPLATDA